ncbi:hypothetical protein ABZT44_54910, partial [Streptomyces mirabilis]
GGQIATVYSRDRTVVDLKDISPYVQKEMRQESHATKAAASLARTIDYDKQAAEDAAAADKAAGNAEGYAKDARASADQAELDASAARSAATQAEQDAKEARSAADRADTAATEAEQAAKDADKYAKEAQQAAEQTEDKKNGEQIQTGTILDAEGHIGNVFYVVDHYEKSATRRPCPRRRPATTGKAGSSTQATAPSPRRSPTRRSSTCTCALRMTSTRRTTSAPPSRRCTSASSPPRR